MSATDDRSSTQDKDKQDLAAEWSEVNARLDALLDSVGKGRPTFRRQDELSSERDHKHGPSASRHYSATGSSTNRYPGNLRFESSRKTLVPASDPFVFLVSLGALAISLFPVATWARVLAGIGGVAGLVASMATGASKSQRPRTGKLHRSPRNRRW